MVLSLLGLTFKRLCGWFLNDRPNLKATDEEGLRLKISPENLARLCSETLEHYRTSPVRAAIYRADELAAVGDGAGVATALAKLGEMERFLATAILEVRHPQIAGQAARVLASVLAASDGEIQWSDFSHAVLIEPWATALIANGLVDLAGQLVNQAYYGAAAPVLARLAEQQLDHGEIAIAKVLYDHIHVLAKSERATICARIALTEGAGVEPLIASVRQASGAPIIQNGGDEVEALAVLLDVFVVLPSNHPAVLEAVRKTKDLCDRFMDYKDWRSHGVSLAVVACCRAEVAALHTASPTWRDHAMTLRSSIYRSEALAVADEALAGNFKERVPWSPPTPRGSHLLRARVITCQCIFSQGT